MIKYNKIGKRGEKMEEIEQTNKFKLSRSEKYLRTSLSLTVLVVKEDW
jgi:hypothetical protein